MSLGTGEEPLQVLLTAMVGQGSRTVSDYTSRKTTEKVSLTAEACAIRHVLEMTVLVEATCIVCWINISRAVACKGLFVEPRPTALHTTSKVSIIAHRTTVTSLTLFSQ